MFIRKGNNLSYVIELHEDENHAIVNGVNYIINELGEELSTRTGFSIEEYKNLIYKIVNSSHLGSFNRDDLIMMHQTLNEICNGIAIENFSSRIGLPISRMNEIFLLLDGLINEL